MDKGDRNKFLQCVAAIAAVLLAAGCSDSGEHQIQVTSVQSQSVISKSASAESRKVELSNIAPKAGMCAGWQKYLAEGLNHYEVASCLRAKALKDREGAVQEAIEMSEWDIKETGYSDLKQLIFSLAKYPEAGSLEKRLRALDLLPNEPDEYSNLHEAVTAADYLTTIGNTYGFDTETGMFPNDHHLLLGEIAAQSGLVNVEFSEIPPSSHESENEPYKLAASTNGKIYHRKAKNYGDWYDVDAVLSLLNEIAKDRNSQTRFVSLPTEDQSSIILIIEEQKLRELLNEGVIQLASSELAMELGKVFEERVQNSIVQ